MRHVVAFLIAIGFLAAVFFIFLGPGVGPTVLLDPGLETDSSKQSARTEQQEDSSNRPSNPIRREQADRPKVDPEEMELLPLMSRQVSENVLALRACINSKGMEASLRELDLSLFTPDDVAEALRAYDHTFALQVNFLCDYVLLLNQEGVVDFLDDVHDSPANGSTNRSHWPEAVLNQLADEEPRWMEDFLAGLTPSSFFHQGRTDVLALAVHGLDKPEHVHRILSEGGKGEWGGTSSQVKRAYSVTMNRMMQDDGASAFDYSMEALKSPVITSQAGSKVAQSALFYTSILHRNGFVSTDQLQGLVDQVFLDPRFQQAGAQQFIADFGQRPMGRLEQATMTDLRGRAQRIIDNAR